MIHDALLDYFIGYVTPPGYCAQHFEVPVFPFLRFPYAPLNLVREGQRWFRPYTEFRL